MAKLQYHTRTLAPTAVSWAAGVLTVDFGDPHLLLATDTIYIEWQNFPSAGAYLVATAPTSTRITIALAVKPETLNFIVYVKYFSTGYTGGEVISSFTSNGTKPVMVQSFVQGTGGATYTLQVSLNGTHWIDVATVTHTTVNDHTTYTIIDPIVNYVRANVSSIGAATKLVVMQAS